MANSNVQRNLSAVLAALAEENELKKCPTAKGLYSFLATYRFLASLYLQVDVLPQLSKLTKVFQKENVNFLVLKVQLHPDQDNPAALRHIILSMRKNGTREVDAKRD
ncbi:unnamed protein product [Arctogadus glacialis]